MKKIFDIAFKDMLQYFRSLIALVMMLGVPILLTGMFYIMFGGSEEDGGTVLPVTNVVLVNQDAGGIQIDEFLTLDIQPANYENSAANSSVSMGQVLSEQLQADTFKALMNVSLRDDPVSAISAVDKQEADVAIVIPENFSEALTQPGEKSAIILHYDPGLTVGPNIVKGIVQQFLDNFSSTRITFEVTFNQLAKAGIPFDDQLAQAVVGSYFQEAAGDANLQDPSTLLNIQSPTGEDVDDSSAGVMVSMIMTGMTVFYVFFTGASTAQSLLTEDIKGTLGRLFTTPTPRYTVLGGKMVAGILMILVQITVLLLFGNLVFQIEWGHFVTLLPNVITLTLTASAFGIFLMSWPQTERQAGLMMGSIVTIMGMLGMLPIFVLSMPNPPRIVSILSHLVPQGWAVEGLQIAMEGGTLPDVMLNSLVMIVWAVLFFILGVLRFRKRFA